jgi:hypothetical protein
MERKLLLLCKLEDPHICWSLIGRLHLDVLAQRMYERRLTNLHDSRILRHDVHRDGYSVQQ